MPLAFMSPGTTGVISRIGGNPEVKSFLEGLGFVVDTPVSVISELDGNVICSVRDSRVAISKEMAMRIFM